MSSDETAERLVFVDIETTGLDRERHEIVEIAWARLDGPTMVVRPRHTLRHADPRALEINQYHQRQLGEQPSSADEISQFILDVRGNTVVAANPAFDCGFLQTHFGHAPWHYRLLDIESFAAGVLRWVRPPSLKQIRDYLLDAGHDLPLNDHTAGADVECLRACWKALRLEQLRNYLLEPASAAR